MDKRQKSPDGGKGKCGLAAMVPKREKMRKSCPFHFKFEVQNLIRSILNLRKSNVLCIAFCV